VKAMLTEDQADVIEFLAAPSAHGTATVDLRSQARDGVLHDSPQSHRGANVAAPSRVG